MIKRTLFKELKDHLVKKEISFIAGPRQAGKTTLMLMLEEQLRQQGKNTLFLNLDIEQDRQFFTSQEKLLKKIKLELGDDNQGYVFIDEIQRKQDAGVFLKGIYDMKLPYKFIVSGSGSVELKEKIHESLVGRKRVFHLTTLTFEEFVNFKTNYRYQDKLADFFDLDQEQGRGLLEEYLNFGGYPRVVLEETLAEKRRIIDEIYQSYLERDITFLLGIKKPEEFTNLTRVIAGQIGSLVNFSELSSTLGISVPAVKKYLWYLQKTFVLQRVSPYFKNLRKEITKAPLFYFEDLGLRNYAAGEFGNLISWSTKGFVFENFVFNILREKARHTSTDIHFWRTKDGAEIDFVVQSGKQALPIEVKYKEFKKPHISRSLKSYLTKYNPSKAFVINLELNQKVQFNRSKIYFMPFYELTFRIKELS